MTNEKPLNQEEINEIGVAVSEGLLDESTAESLIENPFAARQWLDSENEPDLADQME